MLYHKHFQYTIRYPDSIYRFIGQYADRLYPITLYHVYSVVNIKNGIKLHIPNCQTKQFEPPTMSKGTIFPLISHADGILRPKVIKV